VNAKFETGVKNFILTSAKANINFLISVVVFFAQHPVQEIENEISFMDLLFSYDQQAKN
jgi:hypothetical protein